MNIDGKTKLYGLIGNPIAHSLSPAIHNKLAEFFSFNCVYVPLKFSGAQHEKIFAAIKQFSIAGVNITSPFKNLELKYFHKLDENVKNIGTVNTIKNVNGNLFAFNTDVYGIEKIFHKYKLNSEGKKILVFGVGGAAKSVLYALAKKNPDAIYIVNRTFENAKKLSYLFGHMFPKVKFVACRQNDFYDLNQIYLAIQTTTLGFADNINLSPITNEKFFSQIKIAFDLIYSPPKTKFLISAEKYGADIINGFDLLIFQAIKSFEIWHDINVDKKNEQLLFSYIRGLYE